MNSKKQEGTILIIDDKINQFQVLIDDLCAAGFSVLVAQSGKVGYQRARLLNLT